MLNIPQIDALHIWRDVRWDGSEVPECAVHLRGDIAGAEPGTGGAAGKGSQAGGEEGPQPPAPASFRRLHSIEDTMVPSCAARADGFLQRKQNTDVLVTPVLSCSVLS